MGISTLGRVYSKGEGNVSGILMCLAKILCERKNSSIKL
jgi:hypothetical protein